MRFLWTLAIACILAATGARPQLVELRDGDASAQLERAAPASLQHLATRAHGHVSPDARPLLAFTLVDTFALDVPRTRAFTTTWALHASHARFGIAHSARGPPLTTLA